MHGLLPNIYWPDRNTQAMKIDLYNMCLYYSYSTLIGVLVIGQGNWRSEECYSQTTRRHFHDHGIVSWPKLPQEQLEQKVHDCATEYFQEQLRRKFTDV